MCRFRLPTQFPPPTRQCDDDRTFAGRPRPPRAPRASSQRPPRLNCERLRAPAMPLGKGIKYWDGTCPQRPAARQGAQLHVHAPHPERRRRALV
eukprot:496936-Prymnesium_polylepis.3